MRNLLIAGLMASLFAGPVNAQDVYRANGNVTRPTLVEVSKPLYGPWVIMRKGGVVGLELDVMADGTVGTVALVKSAGPELDEAAAEAAKRFTFAPGARQGKPVAVRFALELELTPGGTPPLRVLDPQPTAN